MRKAIRLTGRRNVPVKSVEVKLIDDRPQKVRFSIRQRHNFNGFPGNSTIKLRLFENKGSETLVLGELASLGEPIEQSLENSFSRPSCQLRVVQTQDPKRGLVLGSTPVWTIDSNQDGSETADNTGILKFAVKNIDPRTWTLEFPESDYPTIYLDEAIPNAKGWARNNPVFIGFVLPAVIREIFEQILQSEEYTEVKWMADWLEWSRTVGADDSPSFDARPQEKKQWIDRVIDGFSVKNKTHATLIATLTRE